MTFQHDDRELLQPINVAEDLKAAAARAFREAGATLPPDLRQAPFERRVDSRAKWGKRKLSHNRAMDAFRRCITVMAKKERNSIRRRARLLKAAADLGIAKLINRQEISQMVLEAKDQANGQGFAVLTAAHRVAMERPTAKWIIPLVLPDGDLTIIGGRPKVGKSSLAAAMAASILTGCDFLEFGSPADARPVLLITDDAGDGDTADSLEALGVWKHPGLLWSRHLRLTEGDIDDLLETVRANAGAVVIADSLRSISRNLQYRENDPELASYVYDLKAAVVEAGGTLVLIHHANKSTDGTGVEALSGHSAIAGAANCIITAHYLTDDRGQQIKGIPQRRLACEGRSAAGWDLVVSRNPTGGGWYRVSSYAEWQEHARQAAQEAAQEGTRGRKAERITPGQRAALEVLQAAHGEWLTLRQLMEAMGQAWESPNAPEVRRIRAALDRLVELKQCERVRAGKENTYSVPRAKHTSEPPEPPEPSVTASDLKNSGKTRTTRTTGTISQGEGSQGFTPEPVGDAEAVTLGEIENVPVVLISAGHPKTTAPAERSGGCDGSRGAEQGVCEFPPGVAVELRQPDRSWRNGYRINGPSDKQGRFPLSLAGETRIHQWASRSNLRPCGDVA